MLRLLRRQRRNRLADLALYGLIVLAVLALLGLLPSGKTVSPQGGARVIDGDSVVVAGVEIRLLGIDAPELGQDCSRDGASWPCGQEAAKRLRALLRHAHGFLHRRSARPPRTASCALPDRSHGRQPLAGGAGVGRLL